MLGQRIPLIVSGDFNSTPDSGVFSLVTTGVLKPNHPELRSHSYGDYSEKGMRHDLSLVSCYPKTTVYTNYTHEFKGVLDYIFVTSDTLQVAAILKPLSEEQLTAPLPAIPSPFNPSDHVSLFTQLMWKK